MKWEKVHLVTQCVGGKCREPKNHMKIRVHDKSKISQLFSNWKKNLIQETSGTGNQAAADIYSSQYWTLFWKLAQTISKSGNPISFTTRLRVII